MRIQNIAFKTYLKNTLKKNRKEEYNTQNNFSNLKTSEILPNYSKMNLFFMGKKTKISKEELEKFIQENPNLTQKQIAQHFGVGQARISQIISETRLKQSF